MRTRSTARTVIAALAGVLLAGGMVACGNSDTGGGSGGDDKIVLGFSQVGAESGWRTANTTSIKEAAGEAGIELKFDDAQQKQENQIKAIRNFIQQKVDVIAFSPVVESGWDTVLKEAKDAKIPVILTDRAVDSADKSLYKTFLGSDFKKEGRLAGEWLVEQKKSASGPVNIVELQGTTGSAPANDRKEGFAGAIAANPNLKIIASQSGDFTRAGGKQVMEQFLKANPKIDVLFAHNDDMGLGALEAITAAGKVPGKDITIITVDAVKDGMQALADGKFNFIAECSPLLGPQLMDLVKKVKAGEEVPARIETEETTFTQEQAKEALPNRKY
ncbi:ABC transporter substrate-binding protein [Micromonospora sp. WMMA1998]|uniref:Monosaccharide ABC transporter substrate-binding protein, CUT2 family n=1 Tax=Micromonospora sediminicola TaxID=946078 RepID=A0A1A9BA34_9ACTN|nr:MULTISPECIES: ABC transporter substrate-binding protein [Micromonospora]ATO12561.1 LacI family transcriptional regulator [Micromonospora sp. WMMA2032]PGH44277.1 LacI family transcriptional regulator [Micromonospora sp. WMMA1996]WBC16573.1 ABC transporter substrate-binding protein [Micromonospora sp. WMMA1998]SBT66008.1 monosaccharide ABC transporter substrate-binding protein, CUT2 family [Micromonospora sediminicola]